MKKKEKDLKNSIQRLQPKRKKKITEDEKMKLEHNKQDLVALRNKNGGSSSSFESEMDCGRRENKNIFL